MQKCLVTVTYSPGFSKVDLPPLMKPEYLIAQLAHLVR